MATAEVPDIIRLQKREVAKLLGEIALTDATAASRYVRDFLREFRTYEAVVEPAEILAQAVAADLIYLGDFHALPESQRFITNFITQLLQAGRPVALGLELFYSRHQRAVNDYLAGRLDEGELRRRVWHDTEWGFEWENYAPLLRLARQARVPCLALDSFPRGDLRMLRRRDARAAQRIVDFLRAYPGVTLCVVFGESHLARKHLPGRVRALLRKQQEARRDLIILQNVDALYWRLAQAGQVAAPAVRLAANQYCVFNTSPLAKYAAQRHQLKHWQSEDGEPDLTGTVYQLIDHLFAFLKLDKERYCLVRRDGYTEYLVDSLPEIYAHYEPPVITDLLRQAGVASAAQTEVLAQLATQGCAYVPHLNALFINRFEPEPVAAQLARFLQHTLSGRLYEAAELAPEADLDRFYAEVLSQALAEFVVRLLVAPRPALSAAEAHSSMPTARTARAAAPAQRAELASLLQLHARLATHRIARRSLAAAHKLVLKRVPDLLPRAAHLIGRPFGQAMAEAFFAGRLRRAEVRRLFGRFETVPGAVFHSYLRLTRLLRRPG